jgi:hypothetical protein
MTMIKILICLTLILSAVSSIEGKSWRGIVPLRSNRVEVERLIGAPSAPGGSIYNLKDEVVIIDYSKGRCEDIRGTKWNVARNTVISITVSPRARLRADELAFNLKSFKKINNPEVEDAIYRVNDKDGISITSRASDEVVISVIYTASRLDNRLRCHDARKAHARR